MRVVTADPLVFITAMPSLLVNAMRLPSGDQAGQKPTTGQFSSRLTTSITHTYPPRWKAIFRPSGDHAGQPPRVNRAGVPEPSAAPR